MSGSIVQDALEAQEFREVRKMQKSKVVSDIKELLKYFSATEREEILNKAK